MRFVLALALAAVAIAYFSHRASTAFHKQGTKSAAPLSNVSNLLERAASAKPLDGKSAPDPHWLARMTAACARREALLGNVPRSGTAAGIAERGARILAIHHAYAERVKSIRPPTG